MTIVNYDFSSVGGLDDMFDDEIIESVLNEEWCKKFYASETFKPHLLDFGGGAYALPCRIVLALSENSAEKLLSFLSMKKTQNNITDANNILELCNSALTTASYIV